MRHTLAALALIALPACGGLQVKTEQDLATDFSRYHTYAWNGGAPDSDPSLESQVQAAVDRELPFKKLQKVKDPGTPDLYVAIRVTPTGTLLIDFVDSGSRNRVWRGQASKAIDRQEPEETIRRAVREIFRHYPPDRPDPQEETVVTALSRPKRPGPIDK